MMSYLKVHSPVWDKGKENGENFHQGFHLIYFLFRKFSPIGDFGTVQQSRFVPLWPKKKDKMTFKLLWSKGKYKRTKCKRRLKCETAPVVNNLPLNNSIYRDK